MSLIDYINENALVIIPALYIVGMVMKATPKVPDWLIPFVLLALGVAGAVGLMGFNAESAIQGVLCAGAAVYANQLIKQGAECREQIRSHAKD